jgi:hypothetical protein
MTQKRKRPTKISSLSRAKNRAGHVWNKTYREEIAKGKSEREAKSVANKKADKAKLDAQIVDDKAIGARDENGVFLTSFPLGLKRFKNKTEMEEAEKVKKLEIRRRKRDK